MTLLYIYRKEKQNINEVDMFNNELLLIEYWKYLTWFGIIGLEPLFKSVYFVKSKVDQVSQIALKQGKHGAFNPYRTVLFNE